MLGKLVKLLLILQSRPYRSALLRYHVAAGVEHERVLKGLDCRSVVDVGANCGQFSLVARHCFPEATIVAFEPLSGPAEHFRRVWAEDSHVSLHQYALGAQRADSTMHVSCRDDSSSLLPITAQQRRIFPGTDESETTTVHVERLVDVVRAGELGSPVLLKLDVQGYELEALKGCEDLLDSFSYVYAEGSFVELYRGQVLADDLIVWLKQREFRLSGVYGVVFDRQGRAVQADMLFSKAVAGATESE
jgi:FkbM family methyltransferase